MFENFTFGAAPANPHQCDNDVQPSPKDDSFPVSSISPFSDSYSFANGRPSSPLEDFINQFGQQSLSYEVGQNNHSWQYNSPTPSLSGDSESSSPSIASQSTPTTPISPSRRGALACRRLQRQLNVQLQSSTSHVRDINVLVEDMLNNNSQCSLRRPTSRANLVSSPVSCLEVDPSMHDDWDNETEIEKARRRWLNTVIAVNEVDEGYVEGDVWDLDEECLSLRRTGTPSGIRKQSLRCRTSMESVGGRAKVAKLPRMRNRKSKVGRVVE